MTGRRPFVRRGRMMWPAISAVGTENAGSRLLGAIVGKENDSATLAAAGDVEAIADGDGDWLPTLTAADSAHIGRTGLRPSDDRLETPLFTTGQKNAVFSFLQRRVCRPEFCMRTTSIALGW